MAKRAKALTKMFIGGEQKRGLLVNNGDNDGDFDIGDEVVPERSDSLSDDDDDFPLEPKANRGGDDDDDIFESRPSTATAGEMLVDFPSSAGAFEAPGGGGVMLRDFPSARPAEEEEKKHQERFGASFSVLQDDTQQPQNKDGRKMKKRITKLFKATKGKDDKPEEPVSHCGEIVVDKSKIPTTKVEMELVNGKLVMAGSNNHNNNAGVMGDDENKDMFGKNKLKKLTKIVKNKAVDLAVDLGTEIGKRVSATTTATTKTEEQQIETEDLSEEKQENSESQQDEGGGGGTRKPRHRRRRSLTGSSGGAPSGEGKGEGKHHRRRRSESLTRSSGRPNGEAEAPSGEGRPRRRRSESLTRGSVRNIGENGESLPAETQRRRRRESRVDRGGVDTQKMRTTSDGGVGNRLSGKPRNNPGEGRVRRARTSEVTGRRQTLLDKHQGAQMSPRRPSSRPKGVVDAGMDESNRSPARDEMADASVRRGGGEMVDGSVRRGGEMVDSSVRRGGRREGGGRRPREGGGRRQMRKTLSGDDNVARKKGETLSASAHTGQAAAPFRRTQTDTVMAGRRAKSNRHLVKSDLMMGDSSLRENARGGLSDRDRLRRASTNESQRHLDGGGKDGKEEHKKQALGSLYGGGSTLGGGEKSDDEEEEPDLFLKQAEVARRGHFGSDPEIQETLVEESEEEEESDGDHENDACDDKKGRGSDAGSLGAMDLADNAISSALESRQFTNKDVEKLVRAVARQAKNAKDTDDLESIVLGALHSGSTATGCQMSARDLEASFLGMIDEEDDISVASESDDDEISAGGLSTKDIQEKTRKFVNTFLKENKIGAVAEGDELDRSATGKRTLNPRLDYTSAFKGIGDNARQDADDNSNHDSEADDISIDEETQASEKASLSGAVSKLAATKVKRDSELDAMKGAATPRMSIMDVAGKMEVIKAAKQLEKQNKMDAKAAKQLDFSAVASRLEAKAEAKTKARMRAQVAMAAK